MHTACTTCVINSVSLKRCKLSVLLGAVEARGKGYKSGAWGREKISGGIPVKCSSIWYIICALPSGWCCRCCMNGEFMEDQSPAVPLETADIVMKLGHA